MEASGMTYLSVGYTPAAAYRVSYTEASTKLKDFWPEQIEGINPEGTFLRSMLMMRASGKCCIIREMYRQISSIIF